MDLPRITDMDVAGRRLVVRADLNVPVEDRRVTDTTRIDRFAAGMRPLLAKGARLVIVTHFGRPDLVERNPAFSVDKLRPALSKALGVEVRFSDVVADQSAVILSENLKPGEALLCENLRYNAGETANDPAFARAIARLGDIYVNDAFSVSHRAHASIVAVTQVMPAAAGPLMIEEIGALTAALDRPKPPAVAIVGGARVSDRIAVLKNLVTRLDAVIVGGGIANTFLFARGAPMGRSLHEPDQVAAVRQIEALAARAGCRILLPTDVVVAEAFRTGAAHEVVAADACPSHKMILDAGPESIRCFRAEIAGANTLLWNGPLGAVEIRPFDAATVALAETAARLTGRNGLTSIAGGGDTVAALNHAHVTNDFTYVSTAGGAFLEWLEGRTLPGIAALEATQVTA